MPRAHGATPDSPPSRPDGRHQREPKTPAGEVECPPTHQRRGAVAGRGRWPRPQTRRRVCGRRRWGHDIARRLQGGRRRPTVKPQSSRRRSRRGGWRGWQRWRGWRGGAGREVDPPRTRRSVEKPPRGERRSGSLRSCNGRLEGSDDGQGRSGRPCTQIHVGRDTCEPARREEGPGLPSPDVGLTQWGPDGGAAPPSVPRRGGR
jgi:hypothetical protein